MTIKTEIALINKKITELYIDIQEYRRLCPHKDLLGEYKSDTGNWCREDDSYWLELECEECGKRWSVDSKLQDQEYRTTKFKKRVR